MVMIALAGLFLLAIVLLGVFYPGSGAEQVDWRPTRSAELEYQNEIDDLAQMQEAVNERRRRRGEPEITEDGLRAEIAADLREQVRRGENALVEEDIEQMLDLQNARRARKGEPPLTREELERRVLGDEA